MVLIFRFHITRYLPRIASFFPSTAAADKLFVVFFFFTWHENSHTLFLLFGVASNEILIELDKIVVWVAFLSFTFCPH